MTLLLKFLRRAGAAAILLSFGILNSGTKLYMPSTINTEKGLLNTSIWAAKKWADFGRITCTSSILQILRNIISISTSVLEHKPSIYSTRNI